MRISLTVGFTARILASSELYSRSAGSALTSSAAVFASARRLSPDLQPPGIV